MKPEEEKERQDLLKMVLFLRSQGMATTDTKTLELLGYNPALTMAETIASKQKGEANEVQV